MFAILTLLFLHAFIYLFIQFHALITHSHIEDFNLRTKFRRYYYSNKMEKSFAQTPAAHWHTAMRSILTYDI